MKDYDMSLHAMREEDIKKAAKEFSITNGDMQYGFIKGAEWADAQHQWIPCSERMPEKHGWYVGLSKNNDFPPIPCYYTGDTGWFALHEVTHWMTLPPAPSK